MRLIMPKYNAPRLMPFFLCIIVNSSIAGEVIKINMTRNEAKALRVEDNSQKEIETQLIIQSKKRDRLIEQDLQYSKKNHEIALEKELVKSGLVYNNDIEKTLKAEAVAQKNRQKSDWIKVEKHRQAILQQQEDDLENDLKEAAVIQREKEESELM